MESSMKDLVCALILVSVLFARSETLQAGGKLPDFDEPEDVHPISRGVLQLASAEENGTLACDLEADELREILNEESRTWRVDENALRMVDYNLQSIINCSEAGDVILLDVDGNVQFPDSVVLPRRLTLSGIARETDTENGVFPDARRKQRIGCPRNDEGAFIVRSKDVLLANLVFEGCELDAQNGSVAIVQVDNCADGDANGLVQLHHVNFVRNQLTGAVALDMNSSSCSALEMVDVHFTNNTCSGFCGALLSAENELRDIRIRDTVQNGTASTVPAVIYSPPDSRTVVENLVAIDNQGSVLHIEQAELQISDCDFLRNGGSTDQQGHSDGNGIIHLDRATATVRRCRFENNSALEGAGIHALRSNLTLRSSVFNQNEAENGGAGVYLLLCDNVKIVNCSFRENALPRSDGAAISADSVNSLSLQRSNFDGNTARTGGAVYVFNGSLQVDECQFQNNNASASAGALLVREAVFETRHTVFFYNSAAASGGAFFVQQSEQAALFNLTCLNNTAQYGGCTRVRDTPLSVINSAFRGNVAINGGGLSANSSNASIIASSFEANRAFFGGALNLNLFNTTELRDLTIKDNYAGTNGAGALIRASGRFDLVNCTFERNYCNRHGGGFSCRNDANVTVSGSMFANNSALSGGAGSHVFLDCTAAFFNSTWTSNSVVDGEGGGVLVEGGRSSFDDSLFEHNVASDGGGVFVSDGSAAFERVTLRNNSAAFLGGAAAGGNATVNFTDCNAERNEAEHGGAIYFSPQSNVDMHRFIATSNAARDSGGALGFSVSTVLISDSVFENNTARRSGGTVLLRTTTFTILNVSVSESSCGTDGGALAAYMSSALNITASNFTRNRASRLGGSLAIESGSVVATNITVTSSQAEDRGGGMYLESVTVRIAGGNISDNLSEQQGGGIFARGSVVESEGLTVMENIANNGAGGIDFSVNNCTFELVTSAFVRNQGTNGGALAAYFGSEGHLIDTNAFNNSAAASGGFTYIEDSNLNITGGQFIENEASDGGDVLVVGSGQLHVENAEFQNSSATGSGGCLAMIGGSAVIVQNTSVSETEAQIGGAISLLESSLMAYGLHVSKCQAEMDGGALAANESSSVLCVGCIFEDNSAVGKGGAVSLESVKTQLLAFQFDNCSFIRNEARLGGALHFMNEEKADDCSKPEARCTFMALRGTTFVYNHAFSAGGAFLASDLKAIRLSCEYSAREYRMDYLDRQRFEDMTVLNSLERICPGWRNNTAEAYGHTLASYLYQIEKQILDQGDNQEVTTTGNGYYAANHSSGTPIPNMTFVALDSLGQRSALPRETQVVQVSLWSPEDLFHATEFTLKDGTGHSPRILGVGAPGVYTAQANFSVIGVAPFLMRIRVRECLVGESAGLNGTVCQPCSTETYNFHPNQVHRGCAPCPDHAKCDAAFIRPSKGHWHKTPCSSKVQRCLTGSACDFKERKQNLINATKNLVSCNFSHSFLQNYSHVQCRKGYRGPLCGSCEAKYGRSRTFRCEKCFSKGWSGILMSLSILMLVILSYFAIRSSLPSRRGAAMAPESGLPVTEGAETRQDQRAPPDELEMAEMFSGYASSHSRVHEPARPPQEEASPQEQRKKNAELAKWKAAEIFKITINYLQTISIAVAVNVEWTDMLVEVFEAAEFLGAVTSEAATRSVDCLIPDSYSVPRSAIRTVVNIMVPMVVTAMYFVFWTLCLHTTLDVSYLSYIAVTKTALNVLYCVDVEVSTVLDVTTISRFWAVDTSLECYKGSHAVLLGTLGWPVLFLFSFWFPAAVASFLIRQRARGKLTSAWLYESCGFLYRSYSEKFVFWESVVMLRKALLAVAVTFAYPLGGNLQGVLCVCVLMLALYVQTLFSPFRPEFVDLNRYEGLSLLVSAFTFTSGLFFNDDHTSDAVRVLLTVVVFAGNALVLLLFVSSFCTASAVYLRAALASESECRGCERWSTPRVLVTFMRFHLNSCIHFFSRQFRKRIARDR